MITVDGISIWKVQDIGMKLHPDPHISIRFLHDDRIKKELTDLSKLSDYRYEHTKHNKSEDFDYVILKLSIEYEVHFKTPEA